MTHKERLRHSRMMSEANFCRRVYMGTLPPTIWVGPKGSPSGWSALEGFHQAIAMARAIRTRAGA